MGKGSERRRAIKQKAAQPVSLQRQEQTQSAAKPNPPTSAASPDREPDSSAGYALLFEHYKAVDAPKQLLLKAQEAKAKGLLAPAAVAAGARACLELKRADLARALLELRDDGAWGAWLTSEATIGDIVSLVRAACRATDPALAAQLMAEAGLTIPPKDPPPGTSSPTQGADLTALEGGSDAQGAASGTPGRTVQGVFGVPPDEAGGLGGEERARLVAEARAALYPSLASALFRAGARRHALAALEDMARGRVAISIDAANRLIRAAQRRRDLRAVFAVLDAMTAARVAPNDDTYEAVANAAVRSVEFVTGAVSMETLPRKWLPEAAFIGRSNVGKSSLVNMVCNRKALAYTSKRPGKTQQLNFFEVNGGAAAAGAGDGEAHAFYLVDMPGHGYAKVSEQLRTSWQDLLKQYVAQRRSLRVLFHLLDGRHGPVGHDKAIMKEMARLPSYARYVIVLTKADKQDNTVSAGVMAATITALREAGVENAPVVITSAETKLGRDAMWRYLRLAALDRSGGGRAAASPAEHGYGKEVE